MDQRAQVVTLSAITSLILSTIVVTVALSAYQTALPGTVAGDQVGEGVAGDQTSLRSLHEEQSMVVLAVEKADPAVVSVRISREFPFLRRNGIIATPYGSQEVEVGGGSAFFVSEDGLLLTNKHLISDVNESYTVVLKDGRELPATVESMDPLNDIALLRVARGRYPFLRLSKRDVVLGETAIAIGNALAEFRNTVSVGVVSGLDRDIEASDSANNQTEFLHRIIQTDAAIYQGNSGGPLLDIHGDVIGMNTAVSAASETIGFAIPASELARGIESFQRFGRIVRPYLGIRYVFVTPDVQERYRLRLLQGVILLPGDRGEPAVMPGSPAQIAGLQAQDIILSINDQRITLEHTVSEALEESAPGDTVELRILRDGRERTVQVTLGEWQE